MITLYHVYMLFISKKGAITFFSRMRLAWAKVAFAKGAVDYLNTLRDFMKITTFLASQAMLMGTCLHLTLTLTLRERGQRLSAGLACQARGCVYPRLFVSSVASCDEHCLFLLIAYPSSVDPVVRDVQALQRMRLPDSGMYSYSRSGFKDPELPLKQAKEAPNSCPPVKRAASDHCESGCPRLRSRCHRPTSL